MRVWHRVQQFLSQFRPQRPVEDRVLEPYLSDAQIALFRTMPASEQHHALEVLYILQQQGHPDCLMAQAALLHDVGKTGARVRLWHRVAKVLLEAVPHVGLFHPALSYRLAKDDPNSWRYPLYVLLHHAQLGAGHAAAAGTDPMAIALICAHHTAPEHSGLDPQGRIWLTALQEADERT